MQSRLQACEALGTAGAKSSARVTGAVAGAVVVLALAVTAAGVSSAGETDTCPCGIAATRVDDIASMPVSSRCTLRMSTSLGGAREHHEHTLLFRKTHAYLSK